MKNEYPYVIVYQYFKKEFFVNVCHFDFVQGKTLESAREVLNERRRIHLRLQVLFETKKIEE
jgi:hypothetical protein